MGVQEESPLRPTHIPVLLNEVVGALSPAPGEVCLDVTLGLGGYAARILPEMPGGVYVGIDRDRDALQVASRRLSEVDHDVRVVTVPGIFSDARHALDSALVDRVDMLVADLGVSSMQIDASSRGFSWRADGAALDMRMDQGTGIDLASHLAAADHGTIASVLREFGEIRSAGRLASLIVEHRPRTTDELRILVTRIEAGETRKKLMARVFQALRIWVNDELGELDQLLAQVPDLVRSGARVVFVSYHSLEDRRVKAAMKDWERGCECPPRQPVCTCDRSPLGRRLNRKVVRAGEAELRGNPRAASGRLRGFQFVGAA